MVAVANCFDEGPWVHDRSLPSLMLPVPYNIDQHEEAAFGYRRNALASWATGTKWLYMIVRYVNQTVSHLIFCKESFAPENDFRKESIEQKTCFRCIRN